ncbi:MAG TPA: EscU/YscU/HrcU family type III secretion system export apparatus switch protein [Candidatus Binatia bacterium]|nr:EscU/YscU/HrcU family type III secretion system export apparatus switch protein [Candidatus Binatia bacterium]
MPGEDKSQRATPRRRNKARDRGQVVASRELPGALALLAITCLVHWAGGAAVEAWRLMFGQFLRLAAQGELSAHTPLLLRTGWAALRWVGPVLLLGWVVAAGALEGQTGFVFAPEALVPNFSRFNPASNLGRLISPAGLSMLLKSLLPFSLICYLAAAILLREWNQLLTGFSRGIAPTLEHLGAVGFELCWKSGAILLAWAGVDYALQRWNYERGLRMSHQEVREEFRDTEGSPAIKSRIKRRRREMWRRWSMKDLARATVVVTNPNEYAVALEYDPVRAPAPVVIAKGRDLLAQRIKLEARWRGLPLVENPPLARALYAAVEVGQAIPAKLYTAVAELLAYLYRTQARVRPQALAGAGPQVRG